MTLTEGLFRFTFGCDRWCASLFGFVGSKACDGYTCRLLRGICFLGLVTCGIGILVVGFGLFVNVFFGWCCLWGAFVVAVIWVLCWIRCYGLWYVRVSCGFWELCLGGRWVGFMLVVFCCILTWGVCGFVFWVPIGWHLGFLLKCCTFEFVILLCIDLCLCLRVCLI